MDKWMNGKRMDRQIQGLEYKLKVLERGKGHVRIIIEQNIRKAEQGKTKGSLKFQVNSIKCLLPLLSHNYMLLLDTREEEINKTRILFSEASDFN